MIAGIFHQGSGLGDQLFRYITIRTLAEKRGCEWAMINHHSFKGSEFIHLENNSHPFSFPNSWNERDVRNETGVDIRSYDPEINFVEDNTVIDGSFEDDKYWRHNLDGINSWLKVESLPMGEHTCVVGFRGGEYVGQPELFLPRSYYDEAFKKIEEIDPEVNYEVHTDDPELALQFFKDKIGFSFNIIANKMISHSKHSNMGFNWRSARYAKYAIIPNSAFFIMPRILKHHGEPTAITIAPRYWARHNTKVWARPACYYPEFTYI